MPSSLAKLACLVTFALLLSACPSPRVTPRAAPPSWSDITEMQLLFKGDDATAWPAPLEANVALLHAGNLGKTLHTYGTFPNSATLGDLISQIDIANNSANAQVPGLTGLGGVHGHAFLDVAKRALKNGVFDNTQQVVIAVFGQITDYEFHKSPSDPTRGNGKLEVVTYVTSINVPHGNGNNTPKTEAYRWKVHVDNNGFRIVPWDGSDLLNPFPGTMDFTPDMLARINLLGFRYKLWARGTDIKIDTVEQKHGNNPNWITLPETSQKYQGLYAEIPDNCIDMMFVHEPPETLAEGMAPPFYCLGRCAHPLIVNTGE